MNAKHANLESRHDRRQQCDDHDRVVFEFEKEIEGWQLLEIAAQCAQLVADDPKQFAVELGDLVARGFTLVHLRALIATGRLTHYRELAPGAAGERILQQTNSLSFSSTSCFLITQLSEGMPAGCANCPAESGFIQSPKVVAEGKTAGTAQSKIPMLPKWDSELRELRFNGRLIKHFRCPARNQETILAAFEEEGWATRIADPLPPVSMSDSKQRLHDAIRSLNRNQLCSSIRFGGDGTGQGIVWLSAGATVDTSVSPA